MHTIISSISAKWCIIKLCVIRLEILLVIFIILLSRLFFIHLEIFKIVTVSVNLVDSNHEYFITTVNSIVWLVNRC